MTTRGRLVLAPEPLEDRTAPATLRIVPLPGGITGFGAAGTDPNNPSAQNSELVPASSLTVPFGPRELGLVTSPVRASSTLTITSTAPAGLFPTFGSAVPTGTLVFDLSSLAQKSGGLNGGGTTIYTYGLDPNVTFQPLTVEVVAGAGEQAGQPVTLSFGFQATASPAGTNVSVLRQDAGVTVGGNRISLLSRNLQAGDPAPPLAGGQDVTVHVGDQFLFDFTQAASLAGLGSGAAAAHLVLGLAVGSATGATGAAGAGVVGAGAGGGPVVNVYNRDGTLARTFFAFEPTFTGGVRVASADFNRDGVPDVVAGAGPGRTTEVRVFDGATGNEIARLQPFEASFTGGVYVAVGDLDGDGMPDLVVTPDEGGGPRVRVFSGNGFGQLADFFGIDDVNFRGGARPAIGDLNGDGVRDLVVAAGFGGGPRVAAFDGAWFRPGFPFPGALKTAVPPKLFADFFVFEPALRNGAFVAAGDLNGDGAADLIAGGGPGGGPRVFALSGKGLLAGQQVQLANFFAGDPNNRAGVRVAATDLDGDNRADLLAGSGSDGRATAYLGKNVPADGTPSAFRDFEPFPGLAGGVFVG
jgi:hypothetical protein